MIRRDQLLAQIEFYWFLMCVPGCMWFTTLAGASRLPGIAGRAAPRPRAGDGTQHLDQSRLVVEQLRRCHGHYAALMDATTRWNVLPRGMPLRQVVNERMAWVRDNLHPQVPVEKDDVPSSATGARVVRLHLPMRSRHRIAAEVEDQSVRNWPSVLDTDTTGFVRGPSIWVGLRYRANGSEGFSWDYLMALSPTMLAARSDWKRNPGLRARHDREAWQAVGSPPHLGYGFGHGEAVKRGECMFGGRYQLEPEITLEQMVAELDQVSNLLLQMNAIQPPSELD